MRNVKRFLTLLVCALCAMCCAILGACGSSSGNPPKNEEILLNYTNCTLNVFGTLQLEIISGPEGEAVWVSENPEIVTVSETGLVEGISSGSSVITVTVGEKTATCDCTVLENSSVPVIDLNGLEELNLLGGDSYVLTPTIGYDGESFDDGVFTYTSANPEVATVDENGRVTAVAFGNTEILIKASWRQFTSSDYLVISLPVTVVYDLTAKITQTSLTLSPTAMNKYGVEYKASEQLTYIATDNGVAVEEEYVVWRSSNEQVATVDNQGVVTAKGIGSAEITVSYENGDKICQSLPITVTVEKPIIDFMGRRPVLIDTWVDTADFAIGKTTITCDLSALLFAEGYAVTKVTDTATNTEVAYNNGDFTNAGLPVGEYVWTVENESYVIKTRVIVATKVITSASELMNIQNFGGVYFTEDASNTETRKYYNYGGYFVLGNDITFQTSDYGEGNSKFTSRYYHSTSVQKQTVGFTGVFDGLGYRIYDISLATGGIFGNIAKGAIVKNLNVHNAKLNDQWSGVIAHSVSGTIQDCSISANLGNISETATLVYLLYNGQLFNVQATAISGVYGTEEKKGNATVISWASGAACKIENVSVNKTELGALIRSDQAKVSSYITIRGDEVQGEDCTGNDIEWDIK